MEEQLRVGQQMERLWRCSPLACQQPPHRIHWSLPCASRQIQVTPAKTAMDISVNHQRQRMQENLEISRPHLWTKLSLKHQFNV
jgi:hypothetical protein